MLKIADQVVEKQGPGKTLKVPTLIEKYSAIIFVENELVEADFVNIVVDFMIMEPMNKSFVQFLD